MRQIWYLVVLVVLTVYYGFKVIIAGFLRIPNRPGGLYDEVARRWSLGLMWGAGVTVRTVGLERVPHDRPVVYVANHQSFFDILALAATVPGQMRFVAKREMAKIPILGPAMKAGGQIFIDRQNRVRAFEAYEEAARAVNAGLNAVVFAEGTRSRSRRGRSSSRSRRRSRSCPCTARARSTSCARAASGCGRTPSRCTLENRSRPPD